MAAVADPRATTSSKAPRVGELGAAAFVYFALTLVLAWPLSAHPASLLMWNGADSELYLWTFIWNTHALAHNPLAVFDANICYPQRLALASTENLIGSTIFAAPVLWLTDNPVLAVNAVSLLSCILAGLGTYVLARRLGARHAAAMLAGIVFAFSPPRFGRLGQLHLATVQWIPFALAALHAYLDEGRRRDLWLATGLFTLQAWTSGHGAVFLLFAMAALTAWRVALGEQVDLRRRIRDFGLVGVLLLLPAVLLVVPYRIVQQDIGLRRILDETWWKDWRGPALSFVASPAHVPRFIASRFVSLKVIDQARAYLFPGIIPLILAGLALWPMAPGSSRTFERRLSAWQAWREAHRRDAALFYAALALGTLWLSAGAPVGPWPWLYSLPGFSFIRVPSRFTILSLLCLAVLAAFGFDRLATRFGPRQRTWLAAVLGAAMAAEFAMMPLRTVPYAMEIPAVDRWLDTLPKPFVIAELPFSTERDQTTYMLHSTAHWQRTLNGYTGFRPPLHEELYPVIRRFPSRASLEALARLGVNYVVVHGERYREGQWPAVQDAAAKMADWLTLVHADGQARVYRLHAPR